MEKLWTVVLCTSILLSVSLPASFTYPTNSSVAKSTRQSHMKDNTLSSKEHVKKTNSTIKGKENSDRMISEQPLRSHDLDLILGALINGTRLRPTQNDIRYLREATGQRNRRTIELITGLFGGSSGAGGGKNGGGGEGSAEGGGGAEGSLGSLLSLIGPLLSTSSGGGGTNGEGGEGSGEEGGGGGLGSLLSLLGPLLSTSSGGGGGGGEGSEEGADGGGGTNLLSLLVTLAGTLSGGGGANGEGGAGAGGGSDLSSILSLSAGLSNSGNAQQ